MASSINIPSYIMHHVFGFFSLATQLRKLALVCKSWHHASLCMNCITTNSTPEELKVWFKHYFDTEVADLLTRDYRAILGAPYSYVVRNLAFYSLRAIQEAVPHLEAEIFEAHERLANASDRSERIVLLYQWSSLLYLLKKLESMFDIYDSFVDINTTVGRIKISVCTRENMKLLAHFGALVKFRFDGDPEHSYNSDFHVLAAIKCFDFKLLIRKSTQWMPIYKLIESSIGTKYFEPKLVYQQFEQKFVDVCKLDFDDFNDVLSVLEGSLVISQDSDNDSSPELDDTPVGSPRATTQTMFPVITDEQLNQYMQLAPTATCDRQHPIKLEPLSPSCNINDEDDNHCNISNNSNDEPYPVTSDTTTTCATPSTPKKSISQATCHIDNNNNNNTTSNNNNNNNNTNRSDNISRNNTNNNDNNNDQQSENTSPQEHQQEQESDVNVANIRCEDESARFMSGILEVNSESSTDSDYKLMRVSSQTTNDSSTNDEFPAGALPLSSRGQSEVLVKRTFRKSCDSSDVVEDYKYFFDSEENSFEDDDDVGGGFECEDDDEDFDEDSEYGFDDEKENEPPTKFRRKLAEPSV